MPGGAFYPGSGETTLPIIYPPKNGDDSQVLIEVSFNFTFNLYLYSFLIYLFYTIKLVILLFLYLKIY